MRASNFLTNLYIICSIFFYILYFRPPVLLSPPCYGSGLLPPSCKLIFFMHNPLEYVKFDLLFQLYRIFQQIGDYITITFPRHYNFLQMYHRQAVSLYLTTTFNFLRVTLIRPQWIFPMEQYLCLRTQVVQIQ